MKPIGPTLLLLLLAAPALAQAEAAETPPPQDRVREAIDAGNYFFVKAFTARDALAIADLYTEDGRILAPGAEPVSGRTAIATFWENAMKETVAVRLETQAVEPAGELAVEEGVVHLTGVDGGESSARYLVVWKRVGRRWHLHRDIWNSGPTAVLAPAPAGAEPERTAPVPGPAGDEPLPGTEEPPPREEAPAADEEPV